MSVQLVLLLMTLIHGGWRFLVLAIICKNTPVLYIHFVIFVDSNSDIKLNVGILPVGSDGRFLREVLYFVHNAYYYTYFEICISDWHSSSRIFTNQQYSNSSS